MSQQDSLISSASAALLPHFEESAPAQTIPSQIVLHAESGEEGTVVVDVETPSTEEEVTPSTMSSSEEEVTNVYDDSTTLNMIAYLKDLINISVANPVGESILSIVLKDACTKGYDVTFKHGFMGSYLKDLTACCFNEDGILNQ